MTVEAVRPPASTTYVHGWSRLGIGDPGRPGRSFDVAVRAVEGGPARVLCPPRLVGATGEGASLTVTLGRQPGPLVDRARLMLEVGCLPTREHLDAVDAALTRRRVSAAATIRSTVASLRDPGGLEVARASGRSSARLSATVTGAQADDLFDLALNRGCAPGWRVRAGLEMHDETGTTHVELTTTLDDLVATGLVARLDGPYGRDTT